MVLRLEACLKVYYSNRDWHIASETGCLRLDFDVRTGDRVLIGVLFSMNPQMSTSLSVV